MATEGAPYRVSSRVLVYTPLPELGTSGKSARSETNVCGISENDEEFISSAIEMFEVDNIPEGYVTASDLGPKSNNYQLLDLILAYTIIILILITIFGVIILGILWYRNAKKWNKGCERRKIMRLLVATFLVLLTLFLIYELFKVLQLLRTMTQNNSNNSSKRAMNIGAEGDVFRQLDVLLKTNFKELKQFFTDSENVIASDTFERLKRLNEDFEHLGPAEELLKRFENTADLGLAIIDFYRFTYRMFHVNRHYFPENALFDTKPNELIIPTIGEILRAIEIQEVVVAIIDAMKRDNNTLATLLGKPHLKAVIHNSWRSTFNRFNAMETQLSQIDDSIKSQLSRALNKNNCPSYEGMWNWYAPIYLFAALVAVFILISVALGLRGFQSRVPHTAQGARYLSVAIWLIIILIVVIGLVASYQFLRGMMYHRVYFRGKKIDRGRNTKVPIGEYLADHCKPGETLYKTLLGYGETPRLNMSNLSVKDIKELKCVYCNFTFDSLRISRIVGMADLLLKLLHPIDWNDICRKLQVFYTFPEGEKESGADCFYRNYNNVSKILSELHGQCKDPDNEQGVMVETLKNVKFFQQLFAHMLYDNETLRLEKFKKDPFPDIETTLADSFNNYVNKVNDYMFNNLTSCENILPRAVEKRCSCEVYTLNGLWVCSFIIFFLLLPILLLSMCLRILYRPPCSGFHKFRQGDNANRNRNKNKNRNRHSRILDKMRSKKRGSKRSKSQCDCGCDLLVEVSNETLLHKDASKVERGRRVSARDAPGGSKKSIFERCKKKRRRSTAECECPTSSDCRGDESCASTSRKSEMNRKKKERRRSAAAKRKTHTHTDASTDASTAPDAPTRESSKKSIFERCKKKRRRSSTAKSKCPNPSPCHGDESCELKPGKSDTGVDLPRSSKKMDRQKKGKRISPVASRRTRKKIVSSRTQHVSGKTVGAKKVVSESMLNRSFIEIQITESGTQTGEAEDSDGIDERPKRNEEKMNERRKGKKSEDVEDSDDVDERPKRNEEKMNGRRKGKKSEDVEDSDDVEQSFIKIQVTESGSQTGEVEDSDGVDERPKKNEEKMNGRRKGKKSEDVEDSDDVEQSFIKIQVTESGSQTGEVDDSDSVDERPRKNEEKMNGRREGKKSEDVEDSDDVDERPKKNKEKMNGRRKGKKSEDVEDSDDVDERPKKNKEKMSGRRKGKKSEDVEDSDDVEQSFIKIQVTESGTQTGEAEDSDGIDERPKRNEEKMNGRRKGKKSEDVEDSDDVEQSFIKIQVTESGTQTGEVDDSDGVDKRSKKNEEKMNGRRKGKKSEDVEDSDGVKQSFIKIQVTESGTQTGEVEGSDDVDERPKKNEGEMNGKKKGKKSTYKQPTTVPLASTLDDCICKTECPTKGGKRQQPEKRGSLFSFYKRKSESADMLEPRKQLCGSFGRNEPNTLVVKTISGSRKSEFRIVNKRKEQKNKSNVAQSSDDKPCICISEASTIEESKLKADEPKTRKSSKTRRQVSLPAISSTDSKTLKSSKTRRQVSLPAIRSTDSKTLKSSKIRRQASLPAIRSPDSKANERIRVVKSLSEGKMIKGMEKYSVPQSTDQNYQSKEPPTDKPSVSTKLPSESTQEHSPGSSKPEQLLIKLQINKHAQPESTSHNSKPEIRDQSVQISENELSKSNSPISEPARVLLKFETGGKSELRDQSVQISEDKLSKSTSPISESARVLSKFGTSGKSEIRDQSVQISENELSKSNSPISEPERVLLKLGAGEKSELRDQSVQISEDKLSKSTSPISEPARVLSTFGTNGKSEIRDQSVQTSEDIRSTDSKTLKSSKIRRQASLPAIRSPDSKTLKSSKIRRQASLPAIRSPDSKANERIRVVKSLNEGKMIKGMEKYSVPQSTDQNYQSKEPPTDKPSVSTKLPSESTQERSPGSSKPEELLIKLQINKHAQPESTSHNSKPEIRDQSVQISEDKLSKSTSPISEPARVLFKFGTGGKSELRDQSVQISEDKLSKSTSPISEPARVLSKFGTSGKSEIRDQSVQISEDKLSKSTSPISESARVLSKFGTSGKSEIRDQSVQLSEHELSNSTSSISEPEHGLITFGTRGKSKIRDQSVQLSEHELLNSTSSISEPEHGLITFGPKEKSEIRDQSVQISEHELSNSTSSISEPEHGLIISGTTEKSAIRDQSVKINEQMLSKSTSPNSEPEHGLITSSTGGKSEIRDQSVQISEHELRNSTSPISEPEHGLITSGTIGKSEIRDQSVQISEHELPKSTSPKTLAESKMVLSMEEFSVPPYTLGSSEMLLSVEQLSELALQSEHSKQTIYDSEHGSADFRLQAHEPSGPVNDQPTDSHQTFGSCDKLESRQHLSVPSAAIIYSKQSIHDSEHPSDDYRHEAHKSSWPVGDPASYSQQILGSSEKLDSKQQIAMPSVESKYSKQSIHDSEHPSDDYRHQAYESSWPFGDRSTYFQQTIGSSEKPESRQHISVPSVDSKYSKQSIHNSEHPSDDFRHEAHKPYRSVSGNHTYSQQTLGSSENSAIEQHISVPTVESKYSKQSIHDSEHPSDDYRHEAHETSWPFGDRSTYLQQTLGSSEMPESIHNISVPSVQSKYSKKSIHDSEHPSEDYRHEAHESSWPFGDRSTYLQETLGSSEKPESEQHASVPSLESKYSKQSIHDSEHPSDEYRHEAYASSWPFGDRSTYFQQTLGSSEKPESRQHISVPSVESKYSKQSIHDSEHPSDDYRHEAHKSYRSVSDHHTYSQRTLGSSEKPESEQHISVPSVESKYTKQSIHDSEHPSDDYRHEAHKSYRSVSDHHTYSPRTLDSIEKPENRQHISVPSVEFKFSKQSIHDSEHPSDDYRHEAHKSYRSVSDHHTYSPRTLDSSEEPQSIEHISVPSVESKYSKQSIHDSEHPSDDYRHVAHKSYRSVSDYYTNSPRTLDSSEKPENIQHISVPSVEFKYSKQSIHDSEHPSDDYRHEAHKSYRSVSDHHTYSQRTLGSSEKPESEQHISVPSVESKYSKQSIHDSEHPSDEYRHEAHKSYRSVSDHHTYSPRTLDSIEKPENRQHISVPSVEFKYSKQSIHDSEHPSDDYRHEAHKSYRSVSDHHTYSQRTLGSSEKPESEQHISVPSVESKYSKQSIHNSEHPSDDYRHEAHKSYRSVSDHHTYSPRTLDSIEKPENRQHISVPSVEFKFSKQSIHDSEHPSDDYRHEAHKSYRSVSDHHTYSSRTLDSSEKPESIQHLSVPSVESKYSKQSIHDIQHPSHEYGHEAHTSYRSVSDHHTYSPRTLDSSENPENRQHISVASGESKYNKQNNHDSEQRTKENRFVEGHRAPESSRSMGEQSKHSKKSINDSEQRTKEKRFVEGHRAPESSQSMGEQSKHSKKSINDSEQPTKEQRIVDGHRARESSRSMSEQSKNYKKSINVSKQPTKEQRFVDGHRAPESSWSMSEQSKHSKKSINVGEQPTKEQRFVDGHRAPESAWPMSDQPKNYKKSIDVIEQPTKEQRFVDGHRARESSRSMSEQSKNYKKSINVSKQPTKEQRIVDGHRAPESSWSLSEQSKHSKKSINVSKQPTKEQRIVDGHRARESSRSMSEQSKHSKKSIDVVEQSTKEQRFVDGHRAPESSWPMSDQSKYSKKSINVSEQPTKEQRFVDGHRAPESSWPMSDQSKYSKKSINVSEQPTKEQRFVDGHGAPESSRSMSEQSKHSKKSINVSEQNTKEQRFVDGHGAPESSRSMSEQSKHSKKSINDSEQPTKEQRFLDRHRSPESSWSVSDQSKYSKKSINVSEQPTKEQRFVDGHRAPESSRSMSEQSKHSKKSINDSEQLTQEQRFLDGHRSPESSWSVSDQSKYSKKSFDVSEQLTPEQRFVDGHRSPESSWSVSDQSKYSKKSFNVSEEPTEEQRFVDGHRSPESSWSMSKQSTIQHQAPGSSMHTEFGSRQQESEPQEASLCTWPERKKYTEICQLCESSEIASEVLLRCQKIPEIDTGEQLPCGPCCQIHQPAPQVCCQPVDVPEHKAVKDEEPSTSGHICESRKKSCKGCKCKKPESRSIAIKVIQNKKGSKKIFHCGKLNFD